MNLDIPSSAYMKRNYCENFTLQILFICKHKKAQMTYAHHIAVIFFMPICRKPRF